MFASLRTTNLAVALTVLLGASAACGGRIDRAAPDEASADEAGRLPGAPEEAEAPGQMAPSRSPNAPPAAGGNACTEDADCNENPETLQLLGTCWKANEAEGICLCREGATMQPSGRCGHAPAPSCAQQGGACSPWAACSEASGSQADALASAVCGRQGAVCCVPTASCRQTPVTYCYKKGTDAAYVPPCINGWITCHPGDSPDLDL
jgi:hypothetical protein